MHLSNSFFIISESRKMTKSVVGVLKSEFSNNEHILKSDQKSDEANSNHPSESKKIKT